MLSAMLRTPCCLVVYGLLAAVLAPLVAQDAALPRKDLPQHHRTTRD